MESETPAPSPDGQRRPSGGLLTIVVAPQGSGWVAHADGDPLFEATNPIDAAHRARLELARRGGGVLTLLDSAGRHFKRFVIDAAG